MGSVCEAIVYDQKENFAVTMLVKDRFQVFEEIEGTAVSLPRIVETNEVEATLRPDLTPWELQALKESVGNV